MYIPKEQLKKRTASKNHLIFFSICWKMYLLLKMVPFSVDFVGFSTWKSPFFCSSCFRFAGGEGRSKTWSLLLLVFFSVSVETKTGKRG